MGKKLFATMLKNKVETYLSLFISLL